MLRNREIQLLIVVMCFIALLATGVTILLLSFEASLLVIITAVLLMACMLVFTRWRYLEMEKLATYLRKISSGDYSLDVRDNHEGELSILKNEIYKVTLMLSQHSTLLQKNNKQLTDAISDISHQLKTPLTSMMVMVDLLSDARLGEAKRTEFTRNIRVQLERIEWLVSSLLKLSKIDAGTIQFKKNTIFMKELIQKAVEPILIPMDIKQQKLEINGEESASFVGDLNWTAEAIINVLKNCVEHTQEGGSLRLSCSENPLYTALVIEDNGKGIPKEELPYIFKRFYKGKSASEDSIGIGLALAYTIIKGQNGDIQVESVRGEGTRFSIKFYKQII